HFTLGLDHNTATAQPAAPAVFDLILQNKGNATATYDFSVSGLPANVTATFSQPSITLSPGDGIPIGTNRVTLFLTETGNSLFATGFTVTATPEGAPELAQDTQGTLTVRPSVISVTEVDVSPSFTNAPNPVNVSTKILNSVNEQQQALVS